TDDDGAPSSRAADALQNIVASEQNYAQHIKTFCLSLPPESSGNALLFARVLWDSGAPPSKLLNSLLILVLRRASILESFA
ncbi:MAG: hypothetical protein Q9214_005610, partial [Letrouitia sp. 1 TL-2023]